MAFNINEMRSQLTGGGAKSALFRVQIQNPVLGAADAIAPFMIKAASLPASTLGSYEVGYFGRKIKYAGDRTFEPWDVTVINDENFAVRNSMEAWMNAINSHETNLRLFGTSSASEYKTQAQITQYSKTGDVLRVYNFNGLFPTLVTPIEMNWDNTDAIEEFNVTFQYDWWNIAGGITGDAGTNS